MLSKVEWDELNIAVAAPSLIIALGVSYIPQDILDAMPTFFVSFLKPMMLGTILLITLNILVNHIYRPSLERKVATNNNATTNSMAR